MNSRTMRKCFRKAYRNIFGTSITGTTASQILAMREKKGWTQQRLAREARMAQARISLLENPNYQNLSFKTLQRIANVFDVALIVRFVPFSQFFSILDKETSETLAPSCFIDEFGAQPEKGTAQTAGSVSSVAAGIMRADFEHSFSDVTRQHQGYLQQTWAEFAEIAQKSSASAALSALRAELGTASSRSRISTITSPPAGRGRVIPLRRRGALLGSPLFTIPSPTVLGEARNERVTAAMQQPLEETKASNVSYMEEHKKKSRDNPRNAALDIVARASANPVSKVRAIR